MNQTVLVTTSARFRDVVSALLEQGGLDIRCLRWIHIATGDDESSADSELCDLVPVDAALLADTPGQELRKVELALADRIRAALFESAAALDRYGEGSTGSFGYVAILGTLFEHHSNLRSILALRSSLAVSRLLAGTPAVRVDMVGVLPSPGHESQAHAVCIDMINAVAPLHRSRRSTDPWFTFRVLMGVEDAASKSPEEIASHTAAISESVATLVDQIEHVEREQLAVGSPPEGHHLGLFGFGDVAYRPGDLLGALVAAGGPDFRCLFQLEPLSRDENTTEDLKEEWSPWREELDAEIERCLDAHMTEGFLIPDVSEARPPSAELDAGAFEQELALWATKLKRQTHKALLDNLKPLDREAAQKFEKWIERHWDQLIDQRRHPLAVAEVFGRGISDGDVKGIVRDGVVPARKKTAMQICRGDGIGPIDEKVEDPVIKEIFTSNSDLTSIMDRIIESEDPAVHIRMRFMRSSPQDMYGDEEEGVAWMQDCLRRFPDELQDEYERMKQRLAEADEEIDTARAEKVGFFKRGEHRERLAELEGNRLQVVREIQRTIVALAAVHEEQVRRCYGRARWLGAWRGLRRRLEKLSDDVTSAAANIRDAFDRAYDETSEGLARAQKRLNVGERLLRTARYAKDRVDQLVEDEYERLEASKAVVLSGRRIRGFAEGSIGTISDLLPRAIAAELPWTLSEALLKPDEDRDPSFLYDILGQLADCATSDAKVNAAAIDDSWLPLVLPFLSCEGGAKGPVAEVLGRQKMPPFFPGLSTRDSSWALLPGEDELMELRFACIGLSVEQFDRYESMSNFRDQYRQLAAELGDEAVAFGEHYDAWIDGANP